MIDHQALKERLQDELDKLDLTEPEKDRLVDELNVLARILIDAAREAQQAIA
jgi:heme oxygenase